MLENEVVRARIDRATKEEAAAVLAAMGLSVSDAFRLLMRRIAADKALPFEPLAPNAETIEAMKAARRGELTTAGAPGDLIEAVGAEGEKPCMRKRGSEGEMPAYWMPTSASAR